MRHLTYLNLTDGFVPRALFSIASVDPYAKLNTMMVRSQ